jgi:hypothetical protein
MSEQEISGQKLVPVFFVDEVKIGESFDKQDWPLHITLFPPVEAQYTELLGKAMRFFINPIEPFTAKIDGEALFGTDEEKALNKGVPVYTVERSTQLVIAHKGFIRALSHLPHNDTFRREYNPHVSKKHNTRSLSLGDELLVGGISVATSELGTSTWTVADKMRFKGTGVIG